MGDPLIEHFRNPRNAGKMADAAGVGEAGDPGCGAVIRLYIGFQDDRIAAASFEATGSSAAIAAGSIITGMVTGRPWREAAAISASGLEAEMGLRAGDRQSGAASAAAGGRQEALAVNAASFAIEALHAAFEDAIRRQSFPPAALTPKPEAALVAMSGGVDSSVACLLMKQSGHEVLGLTLRLWSDPACEASGPGCCSPQSIRDARQVCHALGLPHLTVDMREEFKTLVVDDFVREYLDGRTPNPCSRCNGSFRFAALAALADRLGAARIATGHYVRRAAEGGREALFRGADAAKDQSYMMWGLPPALLPRLDFPLAGISKDETRRLAAEAALPTRNRPESQEVCFIPDDDYRRFLRSGVSSVLPGAGEIVDAGGARLGTHSGYIDYTVGQRRGLGISAGEPMYVIGTDPARNRVTVGARGDLAVAALEICDLNIFDGGALGGDLDLQVRYNSHPVKAAVVAHQPGGLTVALRRPVYGVAPGQSAVFYREDRLIAGGVIARAGNNRLK